MPNAMQNYLANIRARIKTPLRVRVGGNSMDDSVYVTNQPNMITITNTNAYFNDVPVNFGPVFWEVLNSMSDRVGEMQFIIGLSMQDPEEDSNLIEIATTAEQQLGNRLDAMLLGNVRVLCLVIDSDCILCRNLICMQIMGLATTIQFPTMCGCLPLVTFDRFFC